MAEAIIGRAAGAPATGGARGERAPADPVRVRQRFLLVNRERLRRAQSAMRERQQDFLDLLPLLLHVNHPILPGFVAKETPAGVSDYRPGRAALQAARRLARTFEYKRRVLPRYDIQALYLMGSGGTVAYSRKSDFDVWVCHRSDLAPEGRAALRAKTELIEQWAAELGLEVHFFLVDPEALRRGRHDDLSTESSGTAQHYLLLEEFYRTGLLLAGRFPLWWLVPTEEEHRYEAYVRELLARRFVEPNEYVDFGPVVEVPPEEFFGAALWQLYKSIDSPYKSALKLKLLELYAARYPGVDLLCHRFKRAVYRGETDLNRLDPYIMMYRAIEEHLEERGERERLEFVRRCFYLKVHEPLSRPARRSDLSWRRELMRQLTEAWGWDRARLEVLDARPTWKINQVLRERRVLVRELTDSYQALSDFARRHAELLAINERDMTILGRKLYAAFERKAGKLEIVNRGISEDLWESRVSLHQLPGPRGRDGSWALYRGTVGAAERGYSVPLKRAPQALELIAWSYFNGLVNGRTAFALHTEASDLSLRELLQTVKAMERDFPLPESLRTDLQALAAPARIARAALFINVGLDALRLRSRQGRHLATDRTDALSYSGLGENLALTFDLVLVTTWREVLVWRYEGAEGLLTLLREYLRWSPPARGEPPPLPEVHCFTSGRGESIARRIRELFQDLSACFYGPAAHPRTRYVLAVEQTFYALWMEEGLLAFRCLGDCAGLLQHLGQGRQGFTPVVLDRYAQPDALLPLVYRINRPGSVQLVYRVEGERALVYVVDERGSLFRQRVAFHDRAALLSHFRRFFAAIGRRQRYEALLEGAEASPEVEYFEAVRDPAGHLRLVRQQPPREEGPYVNVQVVAAEGEGSHLTIYCDEEEFSSLEHGGRLFERVAAHVLRHRRSGQRYPIYVTDVDLPRSLLGGQPGMIQTVHFLNQKRRTEQLLNEALARLEQQPPSGP